MGSGGRAQPWFTSRYQKFLELIMSRRQRFLNWSAVEHNHDFFGKNWFARVNLRADSWLLVRPNSQEAIISDLKVCVAQLEINHREERSMRDENGWGRYHNQAEVIDRAVISEKVVTFKAWSAEIPGDWDPCSHCRSIEKINYCIFMVYLGVRVIERSWMIPISVLSIF